MPAKRHKRGSFRREVLLLGVVFLLFGPTLAPALARQIPAPSQMVAGAVIASPETKVTVTTSADKVDGNTASLGTLNSQRGLDGAISLREAITATNNTTSTSALTIAFDLPTNDPGYNSSNGTWTIAVGAAPPPDPTSARALPALTHGNVTIDGASQPQSPGYPQIVLDGYNVTEDAIGPGLNNGITITSGRNTIRGLTIMNFYDDAVLIKGPNAANNLIAGCYLGPNADGAIADQPSYFGIELREGAHDNTIGGADSSSRNLISGSVHSGVLIQNSTSHHNTLAGNWIGVEADGRTALKNVVYGVLVTGGAHDNIIGSTYPSNVISGNDIGINLAGAVATTITGNIVGLAADGHTPVGNITSGILMEDGAQNNVIGGTSAAERNVIAGNGPPSPPNAPYGQGIDLRDANTINNTIQGNYIGVDDSGNQPAGNYREGVLIEPGAQGNLVGGTADGAGNVIAYNGLGGIRIDASANRVVGNLIGVGANRTTQMGNQSNGVRVGGNNNRIGPGNVIAYNQHSGIMLSGSATTVLSNTLVSNARSGICVAGPYTTVRGNVIQYNGGGGPWTECPIRAGILITSTNDSLVSDNDILSNDDTGVTVYGGAGNRILSNSITDNGAAGIQLLGGANNGVAPPRLGAVSTTTVSGTACPLCHVEVFTDDADEGKDFLGATTALSDGTFSLVIAPAARPGEHLTATHTDSRGNTSSFATAVSVPDPTSEPTPTPAPPVRPRLSPRQYIPAARI